MSLTSQSAMVERLVIKHAGKRVVASIASSLTVDYTSPRGAITRVNDERELFAIPSAEVSVGGKRTREFRCMLDDLPSVPLVEVKIIFEDSTYSVVRHESGSNCVVLSTVKD